MAHQPVVYVASTQYPGIISVTYRQKTTADEKNYRPSDRARNGLITIRRASDSNNDWFAWAADSTEQNFKNGKIEFKNENNEVIRTLTWESGYVHRYEEGQPDHRVGDVVKRIYEEVQIQAEIVTVDGVDHNDNWAEIST
ncbi:type VI secretion system tube protein TssD [Candidatus Eisenbacteria bacterium]|uniref:Type VI secretion system tube protein TssD n=1 Tax=Eiseniibacteriota bacterium TaxID=2212470 RepID=A0ABV6YKT6_UNCEI